MQAQVLPFKAKLKNHFLKVEKEIEDCFNQSSEKFVTKDELVLVLDKIHALKNELEKLFSQQEFLKKQKEPEDIFDNLNIFNLRKKYHQLSLKMRSEEVDPFGYDPVFNKFITPILLFFYENYWRVELHGIKNMPKDGPALLVGNHSGGLPYDGAMLKIAMAQNHPTRGDLRFMVEDFLFHFPFLGSLMNRLGGVRASPENAQDLLLDGHNVVVFPEGVKGIGKYYKDKYKLARFGRGGFVRMCLKTRAPMVPVVFIGPEEIHPIIAKETLISQMFGLPYIPITYTFPILGPFGLIPLPSKWHIHLLPSIDFSNYGPGAENDRVLVYKMSNHVKTMIQDTINTELKKRKSIWLG